MTVYQIEQIAKQNEYTHRALLKLNNDHEQELSYLTENAWSALIERSFSATCVDKAGAFLITFDQDAIYESVNFKWFSERYSRFVYIDRIVVSDDLRGKGIATKLYNDLFRRALDAGHNLVVCEVNAIPPNPKSLAFHQSLGFDEIALVKLESNGRTVRYLEKQLGA